MDQQQSLDTLCCQVQATKALSSFLPHKLKPLLPCSGIWRWVELKYECNAALSKWMRWCLYKYVLWGLISIKSFPVFSMKVSSPTCSLGCVPTLSSHDSWLKTSLCDEFLLSISINRKSLSLCWLYLPSIKHLDRHATVVIAGIGICFKLCSCGSSCQSFYWTYTLFLLFFVVRKVNWLA